MQEIENKPQFKLPLIDPPFNYSGNKHKLLTQLFPHFDYSKKTLVDLFTGGGAIYCNSLENYDNIIANDIISDLIETHKGIILSDDIIEETKSLCVAKTDQVGYNSLRKSYNENKTPAKFYALLLCCNSNMIAFNLKWEFNATFGRRNYNPNTEKKLNIYKSYIRQYKDKINLISKNYYDVEINKDYFYYIDPPYSNTRTGYNCFWKKNDDKRLFEYCEEINNIGGTFMVSGLAIHNGKECELINLLMEKYNVINIVKDYNNISKIGYKVSQEVIIKNY